MELNREKLKRMFEDTKGNGGSANGGGGGGSLAGYATQAWVNEGFVSIDFFNRLFTVYGPGETSSDPDVVIEPNDLDSTIKNIKAMFGLWTEQYLSAMGLNPGGTGSATSLGMLDDVDITSPTNGQALVYNSTSLKWKNQTISTVTALANLTDVLLTNPVNYEFLMYNGARWINSAIKTINGQPLYGSGDISVGGGASGNYLPLAGGTMTGAIKYYNSQTGLYYLGTSNTPAGKKIYTAGGNMTIGLISFSTDEGGILVGTDCTIIYGAGDGGYVFKVHDSDGITDLSGGFPDNKCMLAVAENTGQLYCRNIYSQVSGENIEYIVALNSSAGLKLVYDSDIYHEFVIYNNSSSTYIEAPSNNKFNIGFRGGTYHITIATNGNVGIGDSNPGYKLEVAGSCRISSYLCIATTSTSSTLNVGGSIYATGVITALSDIKQKNVEQYDAHLGFDEVANAPIIKFTWKKQTADNKGLQVGSIAQYWQKVLPEAVKKDKEGTLSMSYGVVALVAAISTAKKVQEHERRIADLERENERLRKKIEQLRLN